MLEYAILVSFGLGTVLGYSLVRLVFHYKAQIAMRKYRKFVDKQNAKLFETLEDKK